MQQLRASGLLRVIYGVNPLYTAASLHVSSQFLTFAQAAIIINSFNAGTSFANDPQVMVIRLSGESFADSVNAIPEVIPPGRGAFGGGGGGGRRGARRP
jgi:hypothetical protein